MSEANEALWEESGLESEKLPGVSELTVGVAKMQIPGPHSRVLTL